MMIERDLIGKKIGFNDGYVEVLDFLGEGSFCWTYRALLFNSVFDGKPVILKECRPFPCEWVKINGEYVAKPLKSVREEEFIERFNELKQDIANIELLFQNSELRDYIVDVYNTDIHRFNKDLHIDENGEYYKALYISYDDNFSSKEIKISDLTVNQKIELLKETTKIVGLLHKNGFVHRDIKPSNLLFKLYPSLSDENDGRVKVKLLDLNSIRKIPEANKDTCIVLRFSPLDAYKNKISIQSDIYMLGATLFYLLFEGILEDKVYLESTKSKTIFAYHKLPNGEFVKPEFFPIQVVGLDVDYDKTYEKYLISNCNCTDGFIDRLNRIFFYSMHAKQSARYSDGEKESATDKFIKDLIALKEIYENKGVHPEVMLDNAIKIAEKINAKDFEEELFTSIKEVDNEN